MQYLLLVIFKVNEKEIEEYYLGSEQEIVKIKESLLSLDNEGGASLI